MRLNSLIASLSLALCCSSFASLAADPTPPPLPPPEPGAAPAQTPAPEKTPEAVVATPAAPEPVAERTSLDFGVGFRGFTRSFGPSDGTRTVGSWSGGGSGVMVQGTWYPGASASPGFAGNLGVFGEGTAAIGLTTTYAGAQFATQASLVRGGVAVRVPTGRHELLITGGVNYQYFGVSSEAAAGTIKRPNLYDVGYLGPRLGLGYAVALGNAFSLRARVGFTYTLSRGQLGEVAFPGSAAFGFDAQLGANLTVMPNVQLRAQADLAQMSVSLDALHTASDLTIGGSLALAVAL
jgi:hypothetical protein